MWARCHIKRALSFRCCPSALLLDRRRLFGAHEIPSPRVAAENLVRERVGGGEGVYAQWAGSRQACMRVAYSPDSRRSNVDGVGVDWYGLLGRIYRPRGGSSSYQGGSSSYQGCSNLYLNMTST